MKRLVSLALLALALPSAALANSIIDYTGYGSSGNGNSTLTVNATNGGSIDSTMMLIDINGSPATGTITWDTGTLSGGNGSFTYTGGSVTVISGTGTTVFSGVFSSGTVTTSSSSSGSSILITGFFANGGGTETITMNTTGAWKGSIDIGITFGSTVPEPGTLGLLGTGLVGLAGVVRRKLKA